jgi:HEAT repeat protein/MFS family permease
MTTQQPVLTNAEKLRRLPWNTAMNAINSIFAQLTFFGPGWVLFLNELNFSNTQIGFLLSLLPFTGLIALVIAPSVARFGYKRTFVTFFGLRKVVTAGLLLVPFLLPRLSPEALFIYVALIAGGFALGRSISETGMYPWAQEFIPNSIRGRYTAINEIGGRLTAILAIALASYVLGLGAGLDRFMLLFAIGLAFGAVAVWASTKIPGGAPKPPEEAANVGYRHLARVLKDRNFLAYMAGLGILIIGSTPMGSFLPLYLEQQVGLPQSNIVLMQIGTMLGGLLATYIIGWAADRYGSKPIMMSGLILRAILPLAWVLIPRMSDISLPYALVTAFVSGISDIAWIIGSARLLYVRVVPEDKRAEYMAVYYALIGLIGGLSQVFGGRALDLFQGLSGEFLFFTIDPFFPLFVFGLIMTIVSIALFSRTQADSTVGLSEFAGMFIHGNPILGLESVFRYYRARDERQTIAMTERMANTKSPLTVEEMLEALHDPRFNVRFEAIISIARMEADPRLIEALCNIVDGTELSLSVIAAWALGRMSNGDPRAIETLRHGLQSPYRSIQAHCARALGTLRDVESSPLLLERLEKETDKGLQIATASALGNLRYEAAVPAILATLESTENEGARLELALALARLTGHEHHFIRLLRQVRADKGTAAAQAILAIRRRFTSEDDSLKSTFAACADEFARDNFDSAELQLASLIRQLPLPEDNRAAKTILDACVRHLEAEDEQHIEFLILALHVLEVIEPVTT